MTHSVCEEVGILDISGPLNAAPSGKPQSKDSKTEATLCSPWIVDSKVVKVRAIKSVHMIIVVISQYLWVIDYRSLVMYDFLVMGHWIGVIRYVLFVMCHWLQFVGYWSLFMCHCLVMGHWIGYV